MQINRFDTVSSAGSGFFIMLLLFYPLLIINPDCYLQGFDAVGWATGITSSV